MEAQDVTSVQLTHDPTTYTRNLMETVMMIINLGLQAVALAGVIHIKQMNLHYIKAASHLGYEIGA